MGTGFTLTIETLHAPDRGTQENVHQLDEKTLKQREVVFIDIANDPVQVKVYFFWLHPFCLYNLFQLLGV